MEMPSQGEVGQLAGGGAAAVELVAVKIKRRFYAFVFVLEFFIDSQPRRRNVSHATPNSKSKIEKVHSKATKRKRWRERRESMRGTVLYRCMCHNNCVKWQPWAGHMPCHISCVSTAFPKLN